MVLTRIVALQRELAVFETKRAMLRRAHVSLSTYSWYDGMEIDLAEIPTEGEYCEKGDNEIKAIVIALDLAGKTIYAMEFLQGIIPKDPEKEYETMFADVAEVYDDSDAALLKELKKDRAMFPPVGEECAMWVGFTDAEKTALQQLLATADKAIAQEDGSGLCKALQNIFQRQAPLLKREIEERLPAVKKEREQLKAFLQNVSVEEFIVKCGVPFWIEVSGFERRFVQELAFPVPNIFARGFAPQPVTELDDDGFHYKRIYDHAGEPSDMRIFGFESREQLENILKKYDVSVKAESEVQWAKCVVSNIDDDFHYLRLNELFPQWKESLERALAVLENGRGNSNYISRCRELLEKPVVELRKLRLCRDEGV